MKMFFHVILVCFFLASIGGTNLSIAGELVYQPVNPNFGGNPFNAAPLLNSAQAQNDFQAPSRARTQQTFADRVDRLILNQVARDLLDTIIDPGTGAIIPGTINTGINTIVITDLGTELEVVITNNTTGETTTVLVPN